jgi:glutathione synthase/RimK-type ligase-like ATP-grasp enzyme
LAVVSARVALVTCAAFPRLAEDEPLLLEALAAAGVAAEPVVWDDPEVGWDAYELVVVRSAWDYSLRRDEFVGWAEAIPRLLNSAEVIRWNTDKRYLAEIPRAVPTTFITTGEPWDPPGGEYVVKPTVSSGSRNTARYGPGDQDRARLHVSELLAANRVAMVQPYLGAVDTYGETALMFFSGQYSHAIRKGQMLEPGKAPTATVLYLEENILPRDPEPAERTVAEDVLDALPWPRDQLLYARVDLIPSADGAPAVIELELTEPTLFLSYSPGAPERLAARVIERLPT